MGKTFDAIKLCADNNLTMVCMNRREVVRVMEMAKDLGQEIREPITFDSIKVREKIAGRPNIKLFIDNADLLLEYLFNEVSIYGVTMTKPDPVNDIQ